MLRLLFSMLSSACALLLVACLDNLHVRPDQTGQGLGSRLLDHALRWVAQAKPTWPLHLLIFARNVTVRRFYERHGGELVETLTKLMPAGGTPRVVCYLRRDPARLLAEPPPGS